MSNHSIRRIAAPAFTLTLALGLAACSGGGEDNPATPGDDEFLAGSPEQTTGPDSSEDDADGEGDEGAEATAAALRAIAAAEEHAGGTAYAIDDEDGDATWEVDVAVDEGSVEVRVDDAGDVVGTDDDDLDAADRSALDGAQTGLAEAVELVLADTGGVLADAELDDEDDRYHWSVTVDTGSGDEDYRVDLDSGDVTRDD